MTFHQRLIQAQAERHSWLCVGLDPVHSDQRAELREFLSVIIEATAAYACAFKPNLGFFLARGELGLELLHLVMDIVPDGTPVILDAKFGDIGSTAEQYARFAFEQIGADAVTLAPYVGTDALAPFLRDEERGIFTLCRTSNVTGNEFQAHGDPPLYEVVAQHSVHLAEAHHGQVGLVVGATQIQELARIRALAPDLPFLIPGVGAQGGSLEDAVRYGAAGDMLGPVINIGRAIIYASLGPGYGAAAANAAHTYRDQINRIRESL